MHTCYDELVEIERPPQSPPQKKEKEKLFLGSAQIILFANIFSSFFRLQSAFIVIGHEALKMFEFRRKMLTIIFHNRAIDKVMKYLLELQRSY